MAEQAVETKREKELRAQGYYDDEDETVVDTDDATEAKPSAGE